MPAPPPAGSTLAERLRRRKSKRGLLERVSIQSKLILMLLTMSVLATAIAGGIGFQSGRSSLRAAVFEQLTGIREAQSRVLEMGLSDITGSLLIYTRGETVAGIIYDPFADDFVMAERGSGAIVRRADGTSHGLQAAPPVVLEEMVGAASMAFIPRPVRAAVYPNLAKVRTASAYRCAGHEYRAFASGNLHFLFFSKLMPWDHLAGTLIASEAGAYGALLDGSPYCANTTDGELLWATDRQSWETLRREVFVL